VSVLLAGALQNSNHGPSGRCRAKGAMQKLRAGNFRLTVPAQAETRWCWWVELGSEWRRSATSCLGMPPNAKKRCRKLQPGESIQGGSCTEAVVSSAE
jgi:hypothetical protein